MITICQSNMIWGNYIMNEITNHAELTVEKKLEGEYKRNRLLMYIAYGLGLVVIMAVLFAVKLSFFAILMIPLYPFLLSKLIIPLTFHYVSLEEKMDISGGHITLTTIYGKKKSKDLVKMKVSEFDVIAPYNNDQYKAAADSFAYDKRYEAVSSMKHPDVYYAYGTNEYGQKVILFFEVTNKALKVMKFLNKNTVVTEVSR